MSARNKEKEKRIGRRSWLFFFMTRFYKIATDEESARKPIVLLMSQAIFIYEICYFWKTK